MIQQFELKELGCELWATCDGVGSDSIIYRPFVGMSVDLIVMLKVTPMKPLEEEMKEWETPNASQDHKFGMKVVE